jgi:hypothetical protein
MGRVGVVRRREVIGRTDAGALGQNTVEGSPHGQRDWGDPLTTPLVSVLRPAYGPVQALGDGDSRRSSWRTLQIAEIRRVVPFAMHSSSDK